MTAPSNMLTSAIKMLTLCVSVGFKTVRHGKENFKLIYKGGKNLYSIFSWSGYQVGVVFGPRNTFSVPCKVQDVFVS